jgi:hypothetical protein
VLALGAIVSAKPLDDLGYRALTSGQKSLSSPYASPAYLGWVMASAIALIVTGVLPIISWFATYRFSLSSAVCVGIFAGNLSIPVCSLIFAFLVYHKLAGSACGFILLHVACFGSCSRGILWHILFGSSPIQG